MGPTEAVPAYGFDIETDTSVDGLDPCRSRVTAVGVAGPGWVQTFAGDEQALLADVDRFLAALPEGRLVTWNGAAFDFPFLWDRAIAVGVPIGLFLSPEPRIALPHGPPSGHEVAYRVRWGDHDHIDAYQELRTGAHEAGLSAGLKAFAARHGIDCVEQDYARLHDLSTEDLAAYVASDAAAALALAETYGLTRRPLTAGDRRRAGGWRPWQAGRRARAGRGSWRRGRRAA